MKHPRYYPGVCQVCNEDFMGFRYTQKYCCKLCSNKAMMKQKEPEQKPTFREYFYSRTGRHL